LINLLFFFISVSSFLFFAIDGSSVDFVFVLL